MSRLWAFVRLSRPHFLLGGALLYGLGAVTAPVISGWWYAAGQAMVTAIQLTAHYANEYYDLEADSRTRGRTMFSGGSGVLAAGLLRPVVARRAAVVCSFLGGTMAVAFLRYRTPAGLIGLLALAVAWTYSAPPLRLLATGWGELATSLTTSALLPFTGALVQGVRPSGALVWACVVLVPIHVAMMLAFELPDLETDRAAGKTGLGVRLGKRRTVALMTALLAGSGFLLAAGLAVGRLPPEAGWAFAAAGPSAVTLWAADRGRFGPVTAAAVGTLTIAAALLLAALAP